MAKKEKPVFLSKRFSVNLSESTFKRLKAYLKRQNKSSTYEDVTAAGMIRYWTELGLAKEEKYSK